MKVLGIVPARGGSKGVPRKNIRPLRGKPLLQYTAEAALSAKRLDRTILTTDDPEIAEVGRRCGLDVPFLRPSELARDNTPTLPVIQHALQWIENAGERYDAICLLQPTNPIRRADDIDACIALLEARGLDSVISVLEVPPKYNPHWVFFAEPDGLLHLSTGERSPIPRRQELPPAYHREGSIYAVRRDVVMEQKTLFGRNVGGYLIDAAETVNIDSLEDWSRAEACLARIECRAEPAPAVGTMQLERPRARPSAATTERYDR